MQNAECKMQNAELSGLRRYHNASHHFNLVTVLQAVTFAKCRMQNAKCRIIGEAPLPNIIIVRFQHIGKWKVSADR